MRMFQLAKILHDKNKIQVQLYLLVSNQNYKFFEKIFSEKKYLFKLDFVLKDDLENFLKIKIFQNNSFLILDIGENYEKIKNKINTTNILVTIIDDGENKIQCPLGEVILNPNPRSRRFMRNQYGAKVRAYVGLNYLPIDNQFKKNKRLRTKLKSVLVYPGSGKFDQFWKVMNWVANDIPSVNFTFIGSDEELKKCAPLSENVTCYDYVNSLVSFVEQADYAIGACGVSFFERIANGLPSLVFCSNCNQYEDLEFVKKSKCSDVLEVPNRSFITQQIRKNLNNATKLINKSERCLNITVSDDELLKKIIMGVKNE